MTIMNPIKEAFGEKLHGSEFPPCPFCHPDPDRIMLLDDDDVFAIYDKFPVNPGHVLVIPKRHYENYFDLTREEQAACIAALNLVKEIIQNKYSPDGFNIGINIGRDAGQTVGHVHIHLIPRFRGDVSKPEGGVRGVIPKKRVYKLK